MLAALRIRLKGSDGGTLEEMLEAANDNASASFQEKEAEIARKKKTSLDDLLGQEPRPRPDRPT